MSEKRDLWVPALLALAGLGLLIWHMAGSGSTPIGIAALVVGIVGALYCLPLRLRDGQTRMILHGIGVLFLLACLRPGLPRTPPVILAHLLAAGAFLLPLPRATVQLRATMLGAGGFFALLGMLAAMGVMPHGLIWLFLAGALFMCVQVWNTRVRLEEEPTPGQTVCVYGGTFDPFHRGHRMLAEAALRANERLLIVVAGSAPHKFMGEAGDVERTAFHHRVAMTRIGVERMPRTEVLEMEGKRGGPSYTVDTLEVLRRSHPPGTQFRLLVGADMLQDFPNWREWRRIAQMASLLVAARPGHPLERPAQLEESEVEILVLDVEPNPVSSTAIRAAITSGRDPGDTLSSSVREYVETHQLYAG